MEGGRGADWAPRTLAQTLETILNSFPSTLKSTLPSFLSLASAHLSNLSQVYNRAYLSPSADFDIPTSEEEDSDVPTDLSTLVATLLDFETQVSRKKSVKDFFLGQSGPAQGLEISMDQALAYARMTTDDVGILGRPELGDEN